MLNSWVKIFKHSLRAVSVETNKFWYSDTVLIRNGTQIGAGASNFAAITFSATLWHTSSVSAFWIAGDLFDSKHRDYNTKEIDASIIWN